MKKQLHLFLLVFALCGISPAFGTQLSGTYTIDSSLVVGTATDFRDFASALAYLTGTGTRTDGGPANTAPFGVSGPVVFNVLAGTYTEQVEIAAIPGASLANTIMFDGGAGNNATRILEFTATSTSNAHTLKFNAAAFIVVKNITIKAKGTVGGLAVHLYGASNNITISNCSLMAVTATTNITKVVSTQNGTLSSDGGSCSGTGAAVHSFYLDSNYISGGYIGVFLTSSNTSGLFNHYIRWNRIENAYMTGVGLSSPRGWRIEGNYIRLTPGVTDSKGIHQCNGSISGTHSYHAINNIIENAGFHGIYMQSANPGTNTAYPNMILNNYIKPNFINAAAMGFSCSQTRNFKIANNTILMNTTGATGLDCAGANMANTSVKNNIIMLQNANSTGLCIQSEPGSVDSCDYNVFIKNTTDINPLLVKLRGITYTKENFKGAGGFNKGSSVSDPMLISVDTPAPTNICQKGVRLGYVTKDLFGATRPDPPQIGCAEGQGGLTIDAEVVGFALPQVYPVVSGFQDAKVVIKNSGNATLTTLTVQLQTPNGIHTVYYNGNLMACQYDTITFEGPNQIFLSPGTNKLRAWCSDPNFMVDSNAVNDTVSKSFCTPLPGGTYTIDVNGTGDFLGFAEAADALNCGGITGPVYFSVLKGTYNEQFSLGEITGSSPLNTITFQSFDQHADSVILSSSSPVKNYVVQLFSTSYISFKDISFTATNAANGRVFEVAGIALYDTIMRCKLTAPAVTTTSNACAILFANGFAGKGFYIKNNAFSRGSMGIYLYGLSATLPSDSNLIDDNTFTGSYYYSVYAYYCSNLKIRNNVVTGSAYSTHYGIATSYCNQALEIINNRVTLFGTAGYGIYGSLNAGTASGPGLIMNNIVTGGTTGSFYALWNQQCSWQNYYHNTLNNNSSGATSYAGYFYNTSSYTNVNLRNNIFANYGTGGYPMYQYDPLFTNSDYNLFYTRSANTVYKGLATATPYATLDLYRAAYPLQEKNSFVYMPGFMSNTNLEPNLNDSAVWLTNGRGTFLPVQTRDINGNARPMNVSQGTPDLGAKEITPLAVAPIATAVPAIPVDGTTQFFLFAGDTVGKIYWEPFWPVPTEVEFRLYGGTPPPGTALNTHKVLNSYWTLHLTPGFYNYSLTTRFKANWQGSINPYLDLKMARYDSAFSAWMLEALSTSDSLEYSMYNANMYQPSLLIAGTDLNNPLPVTLSKFNARAVGHDVHVSWSTASEKNASHFVIEASADGKTFSAVGKVKAAGNSSVTQNYTFTHANAQQSLGGATTAYYRLVSADRNGSIETSRMIPVAFGDVKGIGQAIVYPNPFSDKILLSVSSATAGRAILEVCDIQGKKTGVPFTKNIAEGPNEISIDELSSLAPGVYMINISLNGESRMLKVIKH